VIPLCIAAITTFHYRRKRTAFPPKRASRFGDMKKGDGKTPPPILSAIIIIAVV